jgi:hypothetical protein
MNDNFRVRQTLETPYADSGEATSQQRSVQMEENPAPEGGSSESQFSAIAIPSVPPVAVSPTIGVAKLFAKS